MMASLNQSGSSGKTSGLSGFDFDIDFDIDIDFDFDCDPEFGFDADPDRDFGFDADFDFDMDPVLSDLLAIASFQAQTEFGLQVADLS
jgi:hypothetical protein